MKIVKKLRKKCDKNSVEVDLTNDELTWLALEAHKRDITLNEFVNELLDEYLKKLGI